MHFTQEPLTSFTILINKCILTCSHPNPQLIARGCSTRIINDEGSDGGSYCEPCIKISCPKRDSNTSILICSIKQILKPKKIRDRSLDPKNTEVRKCSGTEKYVGPPRHCYCEYLPPLGPDVETSSGFGKSLLTQQTSFRIISNNDLPYVAFLGTPLLLFFAQEQHLGVGYSLILVNREIELLISVIRCFSRL